MGLIQVPALSHAPESSLLGDCCAPGLTIVEDRSPTEVADLHLSQLSPPAPSCWEEAFQGGNLLGLSHALHLRDQMGADPEILRMVMAYLGGSASFLFGGAPRLPMILFAGTRLVEAQSEDRLRVPYLRQEGDHLLVAFLLVGSIPDKDVIIATARDNVFANKAPKTS